MANSVQLGQSVGAIETLTSSATTQASGTILIGAINVVTPVATTGTAFVLPVGYPLNCPIYIVNPSAVAGVVFPGLGGAINGGSTNASKALSANNTAVYIQYGTNLWGSAQGA